MEKLQLSVAEIHFWCSEISWAYYLIFIHGCLLCAYMDFLNNLTSCTAPLIFLVCVYMYLLE